MSEVNENSSINDLLDYLAIDCQWAAEVLRERVKQKNTAISQQAGTIVELKQQLAELLVRTIALEDTLKEVVYEGADYCKRTGKSIKWVRDAQALLKQGGK